MSVEDIASTSTAASQTERGADGCLHAVWESLTAIGPEAGRNLFTHPAYLRAQGIDEVLIVRRPAPLPPALFLPDGRALRYLGRLDALSSDDIDGLSTVIFRDTGAQSLLFEDIVLEEGAPIALPHARFRYQANWRRGFGGDASYLTSRQASNLRRRMRRLREHAGPGTPISFRFERCRPGDVAAIAALNRIKIEHAGRRYRFGREKQEVLEQVAGELGYSSCLYVGDELIAGTIVCVAGGRAYFHVIGYDLRYARFAPGIQVYLAATDKLEALGCREGNFLWGDSAVKADLGAVREQLTTLMVLRGARSLLCRRSMALYAGYSARAVKARVGDALKAVHLRRAPPATR